MTNEEKAIIAAAKALASDPHQNGARVQELRDMLDALNKARAPRRKFLVSYSINHPQSGSGFGHTVATTPGGLTEGTVSNFVSGISRANGGGSIVILGVTELEG